MLYIAAKTLHVCLKLSTRESMRSYPAMFASWFAKKNHSKFWHGGGKMLYIAAKTLHVCLKLSTQESMRSYPAMFASWFAKKAF